MRTGLCWPLPQLPRPPGPRPLAEPFGDDIFAPLAYLHPVVERVGIGRTVGPHIVPREQLADLGLVHLAGGEEARRAARSRLVEIDHQRPAALARDRAIGFPVGAVRIEIVGVRLELLPAVIALPLRS